MDGFSALYDAQDYEDKLIRWRLEGAGQLQEKQDDHESNKPDLSTSDENAVEAQIGAGGRVWQWQDI